MLKNLFKSQKLVFLIFLSIFLVFRISILLTSLDEIYDSEELYRGAIANEIIEGKSLPLMDYLYTDYEGGSLVTGITAIPFFILFGKSYFSLKMLALIISATIFSLWYWIFLKYFNFFTACTFSFLMLFPAPSLLKISLTSWGNHFESVLFSTLMLIFTLKAVEKNSDKNNPGIYLSLTGLFFGFGVFYSYSILPQALAIFLASLFFAPLLFFRRIHIVASSFAVGYFPGIYFNLVHNFAGLRIKGKSLNEIISSSQSQSGNGNRLIEFITSKIPESSCFSGDSFFRIKNPEMIISLIYITAFILCIIFVSKLITQRATHSDIRNIDENNRGRIFISISAVSYLIIFSVVYAFTTFTINIGYKDYFGFRYMAPVLLYFIFTMTIAVSFLSEQKHFFKKFISFIIIAAAILVNANYDLKLSDFKSPVNSASFKGYSYFWLGQVVVYRYGFELSKSVNAVSKLSADAKAECFEGLGFKYGWAFLSRSESEEKKLERLDKKFIKSFYKGLGTALSYYNGNWSTSETLVKTAEDRIPEDYRKVFYKGFGMLMPFNENRTYKSFFISYNETLSKPLSNGIGRGIAVKNGFNQQKIKAEAEKLPIPIKDFALAGAQKEIKKMSF